MIFGRAATDAVFSVTPSWLRGERTEKPRADHADAGSVAPLRIALSLNHDIEVPENWPHVLEALGAAFTRLSRERPPGAWPPAGLPASLSARRPVPNPRS